MSKSTSTSTSAQSNPTAARTSPASILGAVVIVAVVFGFLMLYLTNQQTQQGAQPGKYAALAQSTTADGSPMLGSPSAQIVFEEFADFSCPHCATYKDETVAKIIENYVKPGKARLIYRNIVFVGGPLSIGASQAALCAGKQGQFWDMHDELFAIQRAQSPRGFTPENLTVAANKLKLDMTKFTNCVTQNETMATLKSVEELAEKVELKYTPALRYSTDGGATFKWFTNANGEPLEGAPNFDLITRLVN